MKTYANLIRFGIVALALCGSLFINGTQLSAHAQEANKPKAKSKIGGPRDPFAKYVPPTPKPKKGSLAAAVPVPVPSIQERIEKYKAEKLAAMNAQQPAPKPTTALLLSEMQVTGIFRTPRGYAAMVEATPIKLSYVIYPGETFFDAQLVAIEEDRLVFRHETRFTDGRVVKTVENKPLRQPNAVTDSLTVIKAASSDSGNGKTANENGNGATAVTPINVEGKAPVPEKQ
jgi:hypothetical protein